MPSVTSLTLIKYHPPEGERDDSDQRVVREVVVSETLDEAVEMIQRAADDGQWFVIFTRALDLEGAGESVGFRFTISPDTVLEMEEMPHPWRESREASES